MKPLLLSSTLLMWYTIYPMNLDELIFVWHKVYTGIGLNDNVALDAIEMCDCEMMNLWTSVR